MAATYWASQSAVTHPGAAASNIDTLPSDIDTLRRFTSQLVLHYRGRAADVPAERKAEIHTRYADVMFRLLLSRGQPSLSRDRVPSDRFVGCCRDATVLFLALARQKGIPSRARVGFGSYFVPGWMMDHVVAEVWDGQRWRLVDPQMEEKDGVNWCDLTDKQFITGPQAWKAARDGKVDVDKFVVDPRLDLQELRGWPYLAHNVVHDLVAMGKTEMLLWDSWGMIHEHGPGPVPDEDLRVLDEVSAVLLDSCVRPEQVLELASKDGLAVPSTITRFDPYGSPPIQVDVVQAIQQP